MKLQASALPLFSRMSCVRRQLVTVRRCFVSFSASSHQQLHDRIPVTVTSAATNASASASALPFKSPPLSTTTSRVEKNTNDKENANTKKQSAPNDLLNAKEKEKQTANQKVDESDGEADYFNPLTGEHAGPKGPEPTRYGDWERKGRVSDF